MIGMETEFIHSGCRLSSILTFVHGLLGLVGVVAKETGSA